jgi:hypothetical protein
MFADADDKYAKFSASKSGPESLKKYSEALGFSQQLVEKAVNVGSQSFVFAFTCCALICASFCYGGIQNVLNAVSIILEVGGLCMLRHKIQVRGSVNGISGMTMVMYAAVYAIRIYLSMPASYAWKDLNMDGMFTIIPLLLVCDILKSIFMTHRSSYDAELDILQVKYLIPSCIGIACILRPHFHFWSASYSMVWSSCLYMDVLALMPQVVMMSRSGGKIEAPIAHFVAATFLSRMEDLWDSLMYHENSHASSDDAFSYWMVIFVQAIHLLLVADFMYYYMKARAAGKVEDLQLKIDV